MKRIKQFFKFQPFSKKQRMVLNWWTDGSPVRDYEGIIADGAIRSGKTVCMSLSFVMWAMSSFNGQNFAMCGKTIGSFRRNVLFWLKLMLKSRGYRVTDHRADNLVVISRGDVENNFYVFGGKDERSQDLIQGITLAGVFFDEVALMPESFVNQATGRCSVDGSKYWFNCNPDGPNHWFKKNWIDSRKAKRLLYLHFTMDDNLSLTEKIKARYRAMYVGIFYARYIEGRWAMAEGAIYDMFDENVHVIDQLPELEGPWYISCDFGIQNATVFLLWRRKKGTNTWICTNQYRYSGREKKLQKSVKQLIDGMEETFGLSSDEYDTEKICPRNIIVDPSASALIVELRQRGYSVRKAKNDVLNGIADVQVMIKDGRLLFLKRCCKETIEEIQGYRWDEKKAERGEDAPVKEADHSCDAIRYFVKTMKLVNRDDTEEVDEEYEYYL